MAYELQAVVGRREVLEGVVQGFAWAELRQNVVLIPLTAEIRRARGVPSLPLTDDSPPDAVPESIAALCLELSANGRVAYVEAELFGGAGKQAAVLVEAGRIIGKPIVSSDAINAALRFIGAAKLGDADEFDAVGLGAKRSTQEWAAGGRTRG